MAKTLKNNNPASNRRCTPFNFGDSVDNMLTIEKISLPEFIDRLTKKGIGCFAQTRRDTVRGLSFSLGSFKVTGSKLGIGYSWKSLQERGAYYDSSLHQSSIERSNNFLLSPDLGTKHLRLV